MTEYDLDRFVEAQDAMSGLYAQALSEIKAGRKRLHWIWFIFPQMRGLGHSRKSEFYGIDSRAEAEDYLAHPVLGPRLCEITQALLAHAGTDPYAIFGSPDDLKVRSCMTLFDLVRPGDIFGEVLDVFYDGQRCEYTLRKCNSNGH